VRERFAWKGLKEDVMKHVKECTTCQENKDKQTHPAGLLQPLPIPEHKWESISMDFITGLPRAQGKDCIFMVVDRLTKFARFFPIAQTSVQHRWPNYLSKRCSDYTAYPKPSSVTGTADS
jgi:hypothetical protein